MSTKKIITVQVAVNAPIETVWNLWTQPNHITNWYNASDDWHAPSAENDLRANGTFKIRMAAKDGSASFDFEGRYTKIEKHKLMEYTINDGRRVKITFSRHEKEILITEIFEAENTHGLQMQRGGWQAILDNFKRYAEGKSMATKQKSIKTVKPVQQKITPCLWFNTNAEDAVIFYTTIFKNSRVGDISRYGDKAPMPKGTVLTVAFELCGQEFLALNGGPHFKFTQAISLFVCCKTESDIDEFFKKLSAGGEIVMPLEKYPFSEKYAFFKDKFGVAWQLMLSHTPQSIAMCLLFVGSNNGKAKAAVQFYTSVFKNANVKHLFYYEKGEGTQAGKVKHASFFLDGQEFMVMDGAGAHTFTFNESISFIVNCKTQTEIDYYWKKLSKGGSTGECGWLKDKFGVSWQVLPTIISKMIADKNPEKSSRVMQAILKMKKLDIKTLRHTYKQG